MDSGFLADLLAFAWWQHDNEAAEQKPVAPPPVPHDAATPKAWDAVVGEWEERK